MEHKIDYQKELRSAIDIISLKTKTMEHVAKDKHKMNIAYGIIVISALLNWIGLKLFYSPRGPVSSRFYYHPSIIDVVIQILLALASIYLLSYIAKSLFKGKAKHDEYFRVAAYGSIVMWAGIIPGLAAFAGIWSLVISFTALRKIHHLDNLNAFLSIVSTAIALSVLMYVISLLGAFSIPFLY